MLDLNVDVVSVDSTNRVSETKIPIVKLPQGSGAQSNDTGTSSSSVVNVDDSPASAGDENSSSTHARPCGSISTFSFDIVNRGNINNNIQSQFYENSVPQSVTKQFFPVAGGGFGEPDTFNSTTVPATGLAGQKWLNLTVPELGAVPELRIFEQPKQQQPQVQVRKSRRGPRSRSSEYRGVTFYRRTGRWESHIWDCGKQVYLGGFDTAHAAARAYDRAAIKFRGIDADINFHITDYDEDMQQTKNLTKEEFVHVLRRQSTGFSRGSSRYRGVTLHKCGPWDARVGQLLGKKTYDKAAIGCNGQDTITNFNPITFQGNLAMVPDDEGSSHNLDLGLWVSAPQNAPKVNLNVKDLHFHSAPYQLPNGKRHRVDSSAIASLGGQTVNSLSVACKPLPIQPAKYSGFTSNSEEGMLGFPKWAWEMQQQGHHSMVSQMLPPINTTSSSNISAASSGFSPTMAPPFSNPLLLQKQLAPNNIQYNHNYLSYNNKT